jgi:transcription initiation factor TFIID subunit 2
VSSKIFKKKASLVLYMIEKRIGPDALRKVLSNIITAAAATSDDRTLSTKKFLKLIRRTTGIDLRPFADRWIFGKGCPNLTCGFFFNRKKHVIEFALQQNKSAAGRFSGTLTVRVEELEGPYDHVVNIDDDLHSFDFSCHSRVRKNRKKKKTAVTDENLQSIVEEEEPEPASKLADSSFLFVCLICCCCGQQHTLFVDPSGP